MYKAYPKENLSPTHKYMFILQEERVARGEDTCHYWT